MLTAELRKDPPDDWSARSAGAAGEVPQPADRGCPHDGEQHHGDPARDGEGRPPGAGAGHDGGDQQRTGEGADLVAGLPGVAGSHNSRCDRDC